MSGLVGEVGEVGDGLLRVVGVEAQGLVVGEVDLLLIAALQLVLHGLDVVDDAVVEQVLEMRQAVEDPESGIVAIGQHVAIARAVFNRHLGDGTVERRVDGGVGVVDAEPDDAADGVGQPAAALRDEGEARLHHLDAALVEVRCAFIFPIERVVTERRTEGASTDVLSLVQLGALEMVALEGHHVAEADFVLRLDIQRHAVGEVLAHDVVPIFVHAVADLVEHSPHAQVADAGRAEVYGGVGGAEVEVFVLAAEVAVATGHVDDVVRVDDFHLFIVELLPVFVGDGGLAVAELEGGDACGVGVTAHIAVGDTDGHPHGATVGIDGVASLCHYRCVAFGHDLHIPHLVGVADAERLAVGAVAIFRHKVSHDLDGFTGRGAALKGDEHETAVVDDARRVDEFLTTAEGGLTQSDLIFVDVAHHLIGVWRLRHTAARSVSAAVVANAHAACGPVGGRGKVKLAVADVRVGAVADKVGAIDRCTFGDEEVGAGHRLAEKGNEGKNECYFCSFHFVLRCYYYIERLMTWSTCS